MYENIISEVKTVRDRYILKEEINMLLKSLYESGQNGFEQVLRSKVRDRIASVIRRDTNIEGSDKEEYLKGVLQSIETLEVVKLSLGFEPTEVSIDKIYQFIVTSLGRNVLVEPNFMKNLIGGAVIEYNGEYRDFSLKRILDKEFALMGADQLKQDVGDLSNNLKTPQF